MKGLKRSTDGSYRGSHNVLRSMMTSGRFDLRSAATRPENREPMSCALRENSVTEWSLT